MSEQVIDTLKLEIEASSSNAEKSVERLATSLLGLNQSIKKIGNNAGGMKKVFTSLSNLSALKMPDFSRTLEQLERISKIDFKNLNNQKLKLDLTVSGASETERLKYAIEKTSADIHKLTDGIATDMASTYNLTKSETKRLSDLFAEMGRNIAKDKEFIGEPADTNAIFEHLIESVKITRGQFDEYLGSMQDRYREFLTYMENNRIKLTKEVNRTKFNESTTREERQNYFNSKTGTSLDSRWDELINSFPDILSNIRQIENEEDQVYAILEKIREAKDALQGKRISLFSKEEQGEIKSGIFTALNDGYTTAIERIKSDIASNMAESVNKIPFNLDIDSNRFTSQIQKAVDDARRKNYGTIDVKLQVATDGLRNQLKTAFAGFEAKDITNIATALRDISVSFANMSGVNLTGTGATQFFKALSSVNTQNASPTDIGAMINSFVGFASVDMSKYSEGVNKFANALVRLSTTDTTQFNSELTRFVDAMARFASVDMSGYNDKINNFQNALVRLAKIDTATTFSVEITKFVEAMANFASVDMSGYNEKITNFVNAIKRLAQVDMTKYSASINGFVSTLARLVSVDMTGFNEQIIGFVNSITRLLKIGDNATPAENIREVSDAVINFMNAMSSVNVTDNTVRMAEALAQLSQNSRRAKNAMEDMTNQVSSSGQQFSVVEVAINSIKDSFGLLGKTLKKLGSITTSAIGGLIGKIKELATHQPKIDNMGYSFKNLLKTVIGFRGLTGVFNWLKESVSLGAEITEIDHIVESVFGENMVDYVNEWANNAIDKFGIAANSAKKYAGTLSAMFQASNVAMKDSNQMAMKLTELAGDLSAFYNIDTETAYNKIKSGMAGMVRPLRDLGIDLTAASLKEFALSKGIEKSYTEMSQAEKMMLRYEYLLEQTTRQSGDFQRTNLSLANQMRVLKAQTKSLATEFGAGLATAIRHIVIYLNQLMKAAVKVAQAFKLVMESIFGKYQGGASGIAFDASMMEDSSDYATSLADGANDAADGLGDADSAAKKLKKDLSVLPFDELNQLSKDTSKTDDSVGDATSGLGGYGDALLNSLDFGEAERTLTAFEKFAQEWGTRLQELFKAKKWKELGQELARGLNQGLKKLYDLFNIEKAQKKIFPWIDAFSQTFNSLIDNLDFELIGRDIGEGINILVSSANRLLDPNTGINWKRLGQQLANGANGLVSEIDWDEIGKFFANKINLFWEIAAGFVTTFDWENLGLSLAQGANAFVDKIDYDAMATTVSNGLNGIIDAVIEFLRKFDEQDFAIKLSDLFNKIVKGVEWKDIGKALASTWNEAWSFLKTFIVNLGRTDDVGLDVQSMLDEKLAIKNGKRLTTNKTGTGIGQAIRDLLVSAINGIRTEDMKTALSTFVQKVCDDIIILFGNTDFWYELGFKIGDAIGGIFGKKDTVTKAAEAFNALVDGLFALLTGAFDGLKSHSTEIGDSIKAFFATLDWADLALVFGGYFTASLVTNLPTIIGGALLFKTLKTQFSKLFIRVGESDEVVKAGGGIFNSLATAINNFKAKIASLKNALKASLNVAPLKTAIKGVIDTLGSPTIEGTLICATVMGAKALQDLNDAMRGGNGTGTTGGTAIQNYIDKLTEMNTVTNDVSQELFLLKESWENGEIDDNAFFGRFAEILQDAGVNAETAQQRLEELKGEVGNFSDEAVGTLESAISGITTSSGDAEAALEEIGITGKDAYNGIKDAISELETTTNGVITGGQVDVLMNSFWDGGNNAESALKSVINTMESLGWDVSDLRSAIDEKLGEGAFDLLIGSANTAKDSVSGIATSAETAESKVDGLTNTMEGAKDTIKTYGELAEKASTEQNNYNEASNKAPGILGTLSKMLGNVLPSLLGSFGAPTDYEGRMRTNIGGVKTATEESIDGAIVTPISTELTKALKWINDSEKDYKQGGENITSGISGGIKEKKQDVIDTMSNLAKEVQEKFKSVNTINSPSKWYEETSYNIPLGIAKGINAKVKDVELAISSLCTSIQTKFSSEAISIESSFKSKGESFASSFASGFSNELSTANIGEKISTELSNVYSSLESAKTNFYNYGQGMAQAIRNGLNSISVPSMTVDESWKTIYYPNGSSINFLSGLSPRWYAKGALFTRATLAGLGEAGDEAALPLENKRAMSRIANAITDNMDGVGIDERKLANAIAQGYVQAMMSNQQEKQDPIFNITVMTEDNEVLARAVQRGTRSLNYRNNTRGTIY